MSENREKDSLHGSVKELYARTVTLTGRDEDVREEFQTLRLARYDEAGNKIEEAYFNSDDSLLFKTVWAYDAAGKLVEQANYGADKSPNFKTIFEYDPNGRLIEKKSFASDGSLESALRPSYTTDGLRIEEETLPFSEDGDDGHCLIGIEETGMSFSAQHVRKIRKIYDRNGKLIEINLYDNKEKRTGKILLAYNNYGKPIEIAHYGGNEFYHPGERTKWQRVLEPLMTRLIKIFIFLKCVYSFAVKGELRKAARCFVYGSLTMLNVFVYDDKGRIVEEQTHFVGSLMTKKVSIYDKEGGKAEETEYFNDEPVQRQIYSRKYDSRRNWIEETANYFQAEQKGEQTVFTSRTISYYSG